MSAVAISFLAFLAGRETASAQIEITPTRVMLDLRQRSQEVIVTNSSNEVIEVETALGFKVIRSDSLGRMSVDSVCGPEELSRSARTWLRVFPRRFTVEPRGSRTVRVLASIPETAEAGEFWARLIVTGTPVGPRGDSTIGNGIVARIAMSLQLDLPVIVRKGRVATGVSFDDLAIRTAPSGQMAVVRLTRGGNSAYRGTLYTKIRDGGGDVVARNESQFTVETVLDKGIEIPSLPDGNYSLEVEARTVKKGGANDAVIAAEPVARTFPFFIANGNPSTTPGIR